MNPPIRVRVTLRQAVACWQNHVEEHHGSYCHQCGFAWLESARRRVFRDLEGLYVSVPLPLDAVTLLGGPARFKHQRDAWACPLQAPARRLGLLARDSSRAAL